MGYTFRIGQAEIDWNDDMVGVNVTSEKFDDAPAFGEPTDNTNSRWPSYSSWAEFARETGMSELFGMEHDRQTRPWDFEYHGESLPVLIREHPGVAPLVPGHLRYIEEKIAAYKAKHPDHIAQYPPLKEGVKDKAGFHPDEHYVDDPRYDGQLCRAEWLIYWIKWALENCTMPTFYNS